MFKHGLTNKFQNQKTVLTTITYHKLSQKLLTTASKFYVTLILSANSKKKVWDIGVILHIFYLSSISSQNLKIIYLLETNCFLKKQQTKQLFSDRK